MSKGDHSNQKQAYSKSITSVTDPGGYIYSLRGINKITHIFFNLTQYQLGVVYRFFSASLFLFLSLIIAAIIHSQFSNIFITVISFITPYFITELVVQSMQVRTYSQEIFLNIFAFYLFYYSNKSNKWTPLVLFLIFTSMAMWVRYSSTYFLPVIFFLLSIKTHSILNSPKKSIIFLFLSLINMILIYIVHTRALMDIREVITIPYLADTYLSQKSFVFNGYLELCLLLTTLLVLFKKSKKKIDYKPLMFCGLYILISFLASALGLYPFSFNQRFNLIIPLFIYICFTMLLHEIFECLEKSFHHFPLYLIVSCATVFLIIKQNEFIKAKWNTYRCNNHPRLLTHFIENYSNKRLYLNSNISDYYFYNQMNNDSFVQNLVKTTNDGLYLKKENLYLYFLPHKDSWESKIKEQNATIVEFDEKCPVANTEL
jgi:hypothetical protein